jgi:hypothetical protein
VKVKLLLAVNWPITSAPDIVNAPPAVIDEFGAKTSALKVAACIGEMAAGQLVVQPGCP